MRVLVWWSAWAALVSACGQTAQSPRGASVASGGQSGDAMAAAKAGSSDVAPVAGQTTTGGTTSVGAAPSVGAAGSPSTPSDGGTHAGASGAGGAASAGESAQAAGAAGSVGAPATCGSGGRYVACGCGCCFPMQSQPRCYYPELGQTLASIQADDQARSGSAQCAAAGCSIGIEYICCTKARPEDPPPSYEIGGYIGDLDHLTIRRRVGTACSELALVRPGTSHGEVISVPDGWVVESALDCGQPTLGSGRVGEGSVRFASSTSACALDFDFDLFFPTETGFRADHFQADAEPVPAAALFSCR